MGHFTSKESKLDCHFLFLSNMKQLQIGKNQVNMVLAKLTIYNIRNYFGYFIINNVNSNDTPKDYISSDLKSDKIACDVWHFQLRCNGHIIHLAICVFSFEKHSDIETQVEYSGKL